METVSRRERILVAIRDRLRAIKKADGYNTDAGLSIALGVLPQFGPNDPKEAIAILVGDDQVPAQLNNIRITLPVNIAAVAAPTLSEPWVAVERMLTDIKRAIEITTDRSLGGLLVEGNGVLGLYRGTTETMERTSGSDVVGCAITYGCPYVEAFGQPEL